VAGSVTQTDKKGTSVRNLLLSPPIAFAIFGALAYGVYRLGGRIGARGQETSGKRQPYACGEDLLPPKAQLSYRAFFKLALMFGILHLATLVIATLPLGGFSRGLATLYLVGVGVSVFVLSDEEP
jgi:NADH:ubiquinone oxidoreductase subunit 3 (subunit A)